MPHHGLDLAEPTERFDVARFRTVAAAAVAAAAERGGPIVVAGGTGLYVRALLHGLSAGVSAQPELRATLERMEQEDPGSLGRWAARLDPAAAVRIHPHAIAEYESKLKRLGEEIVRTSRRIKVLEEMVLPTIKHQIRSIAQYISEREREAFYRLKRVKSILEQKAAVLKARG